MTKLLRRLLLLHAFEKLRQLRPIEFPAERARISLVGRGVSSSDAHLALYASEI